MRAPLAVLLLVVGALAESSRHDASSSSSPRQALVKINGGGGTSRASNGGILRSSSARAKHEARLLQNDANATMTATPEPTVFNDELPPLSSSPTASVIEGQIISEPPTVDLGGAVGIPENPSPAPILDAATLTPGSDGNGTASGSVEETPVPAPTSGLPTGALAPTEETFAPFPTPEIVTMAPHPSSLGNAPTLLPFPAFDPPTERPTGEYVPPDDDPVKQEIEDEKQGGEAAWNEQTESLDQLERDQRILISLAVICGFFLSLLICVAHQMLENPDGCCASICRILVACICALFRCVCFPCRMICGCTGKERGGAHDLIMPGHSNNYTHDLELS